VKCQPVDHLMQDEPLTLFDSRCGWEMEDGGGQGAQHNCEINLVSQGAAAGKERKMASKSVGFALMTEGLDQQDELGYTSGESRRFRRVGVYPVSRLYPESYSGIRSCYGTRSLKR
jgi:hypothetical protein